MILPRVARRAPEASGSGSPFSVALGGGRVLDLRVAAIAERTLPGRAGEAVLVGWSDATKPLGVAGADVFAIRYEPGRAEAARPLLEETARSPRPRAEPARSCRGRR